MSFHLTQPANLITMMTAILNFKQCHSLLTFSPFLPHLSFLFSGLGGRLLATITCTWFTRYQLEKAHMPSYVIAGAAV